MQEGRIEYQKDLGGAVMEIQSADPDFVRVWSRVKAPSPSLPKQEDAGQPDETWADFFAGALAAQLQRQAAYRALGLAAPAQECLYRARKLAAARFFLTGERKAPLPRIVSPPLHDRAAALRQLAQAERSSEQDLRQAQQHCPDPQLALVLEDCAQSCRRAQKLLWERVEQTILRCK
jgi:hypothetical protein